jgi:hypothetical protein
MNGTSIHGTTIYYLLSVFVFILGSDLPYVLAI